MKTSEYDNGFNAGFNAARKMIADIAGFAYVPVETTLLSVENEVRDDPACFVREGYKEGREDGYAAGYSDGREDGYSIGYASGREYQECSAPTNSKPDGYKGGHYSDDTSNALEGHLALIKSMQDKLDRLEDRINKGNPEPRTLMDLHSTRELD